MLVVNKTVILAQKRPDGELLREMNICFIYLKILYYKIGASRQCHASAQ
jgi:hypothetical protein